MKFTIKAFWLNIVLIAMLVFFIPSYVCAQTAVNDDDAFFESYTYWNDISGKNSKTAVFMQPIYKASDVLSVSKIVNDEISMLADIYSDKSGNTYILDSEKPVIYILDNSYKLVDKILNLKDTDGKFISFNGARSLYVTSNGDIYLCGTKNGCVWVIDKEGCIKNTLLLPDSDIIPKEFKYSPVKVTVDSKGYVYVLSESSYYGAILYSPEHEFLGFYGANSVTNSKSQIFTNIWNKLFMNDEKKSASEKSLPFSFNDFEVADNDFVFTITGRTGSSLYTDQLKILNPSGVNIIKRTNYNYADTESVMAGKNVWVSQNMSGIAVSGKFAYILDSGCGKIFIYDVDGNIIGVFGGGMGRGYQKGLFKNSTAITINGNDVLVIDSEKNTITVFQCTEYGKLVLNAQKITLDSKYVEAKSSWQQVLKCDKNSQLAYRGLARAALREKDYKEALRFSKIAYDRDTYAEAFNSYRKTIIAKYFVPFVCVVIFLTVFIVFVISFFKKNKIKSKVFISVKFNNYIHTLLHPFNGFSNVKYKGYGSLIIGCVLSLLLYISSVVKTVYSGFAYSNYTPQNFNSLYPLVKTIGVIVLWTLVNWAVCTLFGGLGKIKEIFVVITYSTTPLIISNFLYAFLSNIIVKSEAGLLNIIVVIFWIYAFFLMIAGSIKIHDFEFGKFVGTSVLTIIGILIVIFLAFIIVLLLQQFAIFLMTLFSEVIYR